MHALAWWIVGGVLVAALFLFFVFALYFSIPSKRKFELKGKHALVTGGSKGIGKQLALSLLSRGANVTIVARNERDLKSATTELQTYADQRGQGQKVQWESADLCGAYDQIEPIVRKAEETFGPVDVLINNAGHSVQDSFEKLPVESFEDQMRVNYLSAVHMTRAVVGSMQERRAGHISFVSSAAGQCAIYGYTAYSPTKFALRGLADSLHMEFLPYKISVAVLYPPNTDTEGFQLEIDTMPLETKLISEAAGLFSPKDVAEAHINDIINGETATAMGLDGWMLGVLTAGASPEHNLFRAVVQTLLSGIFRAVMLLYLGYFNGIVKKCYKGRLASAANR
ncbi:unnamed protein product, partial [Mesorhabditis belari]|uniref:3-dehydrosphinganine reductase n=1 Tax=Mesorhabditis belari TaxID=2138241 RepID=A0AAF3FHT1_9BILA